MYMNTHMYESVSSFAKDTQLFDASVNYAVQTSSHELIYYSVSMTR